LRRGCSSISPFDSSVAAVNAASEDTELQMRDVHETDPLPVMTIA
jgi:hypothetical protein